CLHLLRCRLAAAECRRDAERTPQFERVEEGPDVANLSAAGAEHVHALDLDAVLRRGGPAEDALVRPANGEAGSDPVACGDGLGDGELAIGKALVPAQGEGAILGNPLDLL